MDYISFSYGALLMGVIAIAIGRIADSKEYNKLEEYAIKGRCDALVIAMVGKELADGWWTSPNKAFNGQTPKEAPLEIVYRYLMGYAGR